MLEKAHILDKGKDNITGMFSSIFGILPLLLLLNTLPDQLWRTSGDHHRCWQSLYTCSSSSVCSYWLHRCTQRLHPTNLPVLCPSTFDSDAILCPQTFAASSKQTVGFFTWAQKKEGDRRGLGLLRQMPKITLLLLVKKKIFCSGKRKRMCDHKGQLELDTSAEVWSRVFVFFHREKREGVIAGVGRGDCVPVIVQWE